MNTLGVASKVCTKEEDATFIIPSLKQSFILEQMETISHYLQPILYYLSSPLTVYAASLYTVDEGGYIVYRMH